ncbi:hypothetical protein B6R96_00055 [Streptomyces sp. Sge12]|uniref:hypothetical protein n=1 Tax=Streptomyces sp. Sge12 TaxID=1972846 RepID=UPI0009C2F83F|nr:hypothetical protein [Streptomyces sp. Sge12]ARE72543.1 hypothetical protein B6R96_00055 [Streptomyces sp. Sge12]
MDIPDWYVWIALGLAVLQALGLVPIVRRLRGPDLALRSQARLELLETVGTLLLMGGLLLSLTVAESWFWIAAVGFTLMAAVYAVKGVRRLRAHRSTTS